MVTEPLDGRLFGEGQPCFGCSPDHPHGLRLSFERFGEGVEARFIPTELQQGPVGLMHGGLITTVADETAAWAVIAATGKFGFTTSFDCRLVKGVRVGVELLARASVTSASSRIVKTRVVLSQDEAECFTGNFTFALLDKAAAEKVMGRAMPAAWERFCR